MHKWWCSWFGLQLANLQQLDNTAQHCASAKKSFMRILMLNMELHVMFSSSCSPDFELNFSQVQRSSGLNRGLEPNYGSTNLSQGILQFCIILIYNKFIQHIVEMASYIMCWS